MGAWGIKERQSGYSLDLLRLSRMGAHISNSRSIDTGMDGVLRGL